MTRRPLLALVALSAAIALLIGVGGLLATGNWTPWSQRYVQGVDVSRHQGSIDWRALAGSGVRFAYIKATEGTDYVDPRFAANWADAARAGVYRGAYHFFTLCRPGAAQASHFIRTVPRIQGALPPVVDLEHMGPCRRGPTFTNVNDNVRDYLDIVERHYGARPILYVTREFHDAHLSDVRGERFWVRSLFVAPRFRGRDWVFWQHHNRARRPGVPKPIDLNSFRGDEAALAALTDGTVLRSPDRATMK